jgi:hypothetical protein
MEHKFCRECGAEMVKRIGVNRAIFIECPKGPFGNHDTVFTGEYQPPKFDPVTGERNASE